MKNIAIHGRKIKFTSFKEVKALFHQLISRKIQLSVSSDFLNLNEELLSDFLFEVYTPQRVQKNLMHLLV